MKKIRKIAYISLFAALMCAGSFICIPTTPPFTMQTFVIFLSLLSLGAAKASLSVSVYLLLGFIGLPVFSSFQGGIGALLNPTGGFIIGFLLMPVVFALAMGILKLKPFYSGIISLIPLYAIGVVWFIFISGIGFTLDSVITAVLTYVMPFIIPDILKLLLAIFIHNRIKGWIRL